MFLSKIWFFLITRWASGLSPSSSLIVVVLRFFLPVSSYSVMRISRSMVVESPSRGVSVLVSVLRRRPWSSTVRLRIVPLPSSCCGPDPLWP